MKAIFALLIICWASASFAQDEPIRGRMICEVLSTRFVPADGYSSVSDAGLSKGYSPGLTLIIDYTHDPASGLTLYLGESNRTNILIEEPFPTHSFNGVSPITNGAEYRKLYSEVTLGEHLVSYRGKDQLFVKRSCSADVWKGHFIQTYVAGHFTQVVSLNCRPFVDAFTDVIARLK